jgi:hypothetical protein
VIHPSESELKNAIDWVGGTILTVALFILLFALTEGNVVGWTKAYIPTIIAVAILLLGCFFAWQLYLEKRTVRRPLIKLSLFKNTRVAAAMVSSVYSSSTINQYY